MSALFDATKVTPFAGGSRGVIGALVDASILESVRRYRREVAKRYRTVGVADIERHLPPGKLFVSGKLDGELWFLVKRGAEVFLSGYNGRIFSGTSLTKELAKALAKDGDAIFAGELVARPAQGRARVQHVAAAFHSEALESTLTFRPFDIVELAGLEPGKTPYGKRLELLHARFGEGERIGVPPTVVGEAKDAAAYYREWVSGSRFEGLVIRSEIGITYKVKPFFSIDAVVIAFGTRVVAEVPQIRELSLGLLRDDGTIQHIGPVGTGFSEDDRAKWLDRLTKIEIASSFRMANRDGTLCRFVRPEIVVEVQVTDLVETDTSDAPVTRMGLRFDPKAGWSSLGEGRVPALLHPVMLRERTDKPVDVGTVGMEQLWSRLPSAMEASEAPAHLAPSEILLRRVWTKGDTAVRKVVLVDTHKEPHQGFARFVVFGTDFSAGRAKPLETSLTTSSTKEGAEKVVEAWVAENVKKGWVELGGDAPPPPPPKPEKAAKAEKAPKAEKTAATENTNPEDAPKPAKKPSKKAAKPEG